MAVQDIYKLCTFEYIYSWKKAKQLPRQSRINHLHDFFSNRDSETSERKGISFKSSRNKRNSHTSSTREETNSACSETSLTRSETSLARSETSLTCSETSSTRYASRSTRNESSCPRQYRGTQPSCLPKSRKRLTFPFKSESAGYSSDDSWDPEGKSRRMSERKSEVPERLRPRTSTKRSRKDLRNTRPSKVLREMQNILWQLVRTRVLYFVLNTVEIKNCWWKKKQQKSLISYIQQKLENGWVTSMVELTLNKYSL